MIKLLYSISPTNSDLVGISLLSFLENNKGNVSSVYLINNGVEQNTLDEIDSLTSNYNVSLNIIETHQFEKIMKNLKMTSFDDFEKYSRLFVASLLSSETKVLFVVPSTICVNSINELWEYDLTRFLIGGVPDCLNYRYLENIGLRKGELYLESGVLLMNLKLMRETRIETSFVEYMHANSFLPFEEESVLNGTVPNIYKFVFPIKYNAYTSVFFLKRKQLMKAQNMDYFEVNGYEYVKARQHPVIINYNFSIVNNQKPWEKKCLHPMTDAFSSHKSLSSWAEIPLRKDGRKFVHRFENMLYQITPKFISLALFGRKYGVRIPLKNRATILKRKDLTLVEKRYRKELDN